MLDEDEDIRSPIRKVIRVESERTEYGKRRGRKDFRTERGERSAEQRSEKTLRRRIGEECGK